MIPPYCGWHMLHHAALAVPKNWPPPSIKVGPVHSKSKLFRHGFVSMKDMKAKTQNHHLTQPLPNPRLSLHTGEASAQQDNVTSHGPVWPTCPNFSRSCWPFSWISELPLLIAALMTSAARRLRNFALPSLLSAKFPKAWKAHHCTPVLVV